MAGSLVGASLGQYVGSTYPGPPLVPALLSRNAAVSCASCSRSAAASSFRPFGAGQHGSLGLAGLRQLGLQPGDALGSAPPLSLGLVLEIHQFLT